METLDLVSTTQYNNALVHVRDQHNLFKFSAQNFAQVYGGLDITDQPRFRYSVGPSFYNDWFRNSQYSFKYPFFESCSPNPLPFENNPGLVSDVLQLHNEIVRTDCGTLRNLIVSQEEPGDVQECSTNFADFSHANKATNVACQFQLSQIKHNADMFVTFIVHKDPVQFSLKLVKFIQDHQFMKFGSCQDSDPGCLLFKTKFPDFRCVGDTAPKTENQKKMRDKYGTFDKFTHSLGVISRYYHFQPRVSSKTFTRDKICSNDWLCRMHKHSPQIVESTEKDIQIENVGTVTEIGPETRLLFGHHGCDSSQVSENNDDIIHGMTISTLANKLVYAANLQDWTKSQKNENKIPAHPCRTISKLPELDELSRKSEHHNILAVSDSTKQHQVFWFPLGMPVKFFKNTDCTGDVVEPARGDGYATAIACAYALDQVAATDRLICQYDVFDVSVYVNHNTALSFQIMATSQCPEHHESVSNDPDAVYITKCNQCAWNEYAVFQFINFLKITTSQCVLCTTNSYSLQREDNGAYCKSCTHRDNNRIALPRELVDLSRHEHCDFGADKLLGLCCECNIDHYMRNFECTPVPRIQINGDEVFDHHKTRNDQSQWIIKVVPVGRFLQGNPVTNKLGDCPQQEPTYSNFSYISLCGGKMTDDTTFLWVKILPQHSTSIEYKIYSSLSKKIGHFNDTDRIQIIHSEESLPQESSVQILRHGHRQKCRVCTNGFFNERCTSEDGGFAGDCQRCKAENDIEEFEWLYHRLPPNHRGQPACNQWTDSPPQKILQDYITKSCRHSVQRDDGYYICVGCGKSPQHVSRWAGPTFITDNKPSPCQCEYNEGYNTTDDPCCKDGTGNFLTAASSVYYECGSMIPYCPEGWYVDQACWQNSDKSWNALCCLECELCTGLQKKHHEWQRCPGYTRHDSQQCVANCDLGYYYDQEKQKCHQCNTCTDGAMVPSFKTQTFFS